MADFTYTPPAPSTKAHRKRCRALAAEFNAGRLTFGEYMDAVAFEIDRETNRMTSRKQREEAAAERRRRRYLARRTPEQDEERRSIINRVLLSAPSRPAFHAHAPITAQTA